MMGAGMASNLQKAGHQLVCMTCRARPPSRHLANGATWAESPRAVAEAVDMCSPPADAGRCEKVGYGEDRVVVRLRKGRRVWISPPMRSALCARCMHSWLNTASSFSTRRSTAARGANSGRLAIWVGGDKAVFDKYRNGARRDGRRGALQSSDRAGSIAKLVQTPRWRRGEHRDGRGVHHGV
jgi:3-hydroxyisobutyrate dehydrogenase